MEKRKREEETEKENKRKKLNEVQVIEKKKSMWSVFKKVEQKKDGNCLFSSILCQINDYKTIEEMRIAVSNFLADSGNWLLVRDCEGKQDKQKEYDYHVINMKRMGVWAKDTEINAFAILLKRDIISFEVKDRNVVCMRGYSYTDESTQILTPHGVDVDAMYKFYKEQNPILLLWDADEKNHWDALLPK